MMVFVDDGVDYAGDIGVSDSGEKLREKFKKKYEKYFFWQFLQTTLRAKGVPSDVIAAALNKILKDSGDKVMISSKHEAGLENQTLMSHSRLVYWLPWRLLCRTTTSRWTRSTRCWR